MLDAPVIIEDTARSLYAAHHWRDMITETAMNRLSQQEYEQRAKERWDSGDAGEMTYLKFRNYSEIAFPIYRDAILADLIVETQKPNEDQKPSPLPVLLKSKSTELMKAA